MNQASESTQLSGPFRRAMKIIFIVFIINGLLVASHEGEFWPFSIYPMFSQGAKPWTRAAVRDITEDVREAQQTAEAGFWESTSFREMPGQPYALQNEGIDTIDFSNFVSKTENWTDGRREALRTMFGDRVLQEEQRVLLIMKVSGNIDENDDITIQAVPLFMIDGEGSIANPTLPDSYFFSSKEAGTRQSVRFTP
ncbi:MAG: hypothetical protein ACOC2C_01330 [Cyclonatronaceae bacterium]